MLDVLIPATLRPGVLETTLRSFRDKMWKDVRVHAVLNIDPVGENVDVLDIVRVAEQYCDTVTHRVSKKAHFGEAFKWLWGMASERLVLYLEDDWELLIDVDILDMADIMRRNHRLAALRLPFVPSRGGRYRNWGVEFEKVGGFFECPGDKILEVGFCGHPTLLNGWFVRHCSPLLNGSINPEKQFHSGNGRLLRELERWRFGVYSMENQGPAVVDIGKQWRGEHGFRKKGVGAFFTEWQ